VTTEQEDLALFIDPVADELLHSTNLARLAYTWRDGTPRVVPIWFHWDGEAIVLGSPPNAPKVNVLPDSSKVALTIDRHEFPYHALLIRGTAHAETVEGVTPEYEACAERYFGKDRTLIIPSRSSRMLKRSPFVAIGVSPMPYLRDEPSTPPHANLMGVFS
jgi:hypothetical protein